MKNIKKYNFPVSQVRKFLEPGPIVLVSSAWKDERDIMTMGWHMVLWEEPSRIAGMIWDQNHSHELIKKSKECVINVPSTDMADEVVKIGNCSGKEIDKFEKFELTPMKGKIVSAPLIRECFANFECKLVDTSMIKKYNLFIFEVVKAHVAKIPKLPETIHYRGEGEFMISGPTVKKYRKHFVSKNL